MSGMSYLTFLTMFILSPILLLALTHPLPLGGVPNWRSRYSLPLICIIAFLYTIPWDNYLVYRGVWGYGTDRVLGTVGYVPLEEYAFFILQPLLTGLFLTQLLSRTEAHNSGSISSVRRTGVLLYLVLTACGVLLLTFAPSRGLYMGLILVWAGPVLAATWYVGAPLIWTYRRTFLWGTAAPTLYLWVADRLALESGIWYIAEEFSLGLHIFGLPLEEAAFFLMTNLLVNQGLFLFLFGDCLPAPFPTRPPKPELEHER